MAPPSSLLTHDVRSPPLWACCAIAGIGNRAAAHPAAENLALPADPFQRLELITLSIDAKSNRPGYQELDETARAKGSGWAVAERDAAAKSRTGLIGRSTRV